MIYKEQTQDIASNVRVLHEIIKPNNSIDIRNVSIVGKKLKTPLREEHR